MPRVGFHPPFEECTDVLNEKSEAHTNQASTAGVIDGGVFKFGPPKESIFLTTFYGLYFQSSLHMYRQSTVKTPDIKTSK